MVCSECLQRTAFILEFGARGGGGILVIEQGVGYVPEGSYEVPSVPGFLENS